MNRRQEGRKEGRKMKVGCKDGMEWDGMGALA